MRAAQPDGSVAAGAPVQFDQWAQVRSDALRGAAAFRQCEQLDSRVRALQERVDGATESAAHYSLALDHIEGKLELLATKIGDLVEELSRSVRSSDLFVQQSIGALQNVVKESGGVRREVAGLRDELRSAIAPEAHAVGATD
jgi:predicted  nucleic acid-binding Zn-ribbon protein